MATQVNQKVGICWMTFLYTCACFLSLFISRNPPHIWNALPQKFKSSFFGQLLQMVFLFSAWFRPFAWLSCCVWTWLQFVYTFISCRTAWFYMPSCPFTVPLSLSLLLVSFSVSPLWRNLFAHSFIYIYFSWMLQCYAMNFHIIIKLGLMIHMIHIETVQFNVIFSSQLGFCVAAAFFPRLLLR